MINLESSQFDLLLIFTFIAIKQTCGYILLLQGSNTLSLLLAVTVLFTLEATNPVCCYILLLWSNQLNFKYPSYGNKKSP